MIVACPNCQSKYNLPEEKIASNGSKVRCARCKHVFTVMPPGKDFDQELADLSAAETKPAAPPAPPKPAPKPAPAPAPEPEAPEAPAAKKMPWEDDEPEGPLGAPAAAKKMPWEDDEPAAGPADDEDESPAAPSGHAAAEPAAGPFAESSGSPAAKDDDFLNSLGGGVSLDAPKPKEKASGKKKWIILGVVLGLLAVGGGAAFYFKPWTKMNIPFLSSSTKKEGADNAEKVKDIALRNVRQYYIPNEKAGNIFVVEGKAVNNFTTPKERIKVEISLFDEKGHVLATKQLLCGNTLSQFQLQVQSEEEINASLSSEVGILTSNTYLKTGMDTPFMAVFFKPPDTVKEFGVKVIDAQNPK
jgi:predicted Zn finger-like uncharacterized protein